MRASSLITALLTLILVGCGQQSPDAGRQVAEAQAADHVYTNGKIYTVDEAQPWAEAIAVKDGRLLAVGSNADVEVSIGDGTEVTDLAGRLVIPGLVDTHSHPGVAAYDLFNKWALPSTFDSPTWEELLAALREGQQAMADAPWFLGHSYTRTVWPQDQYNRWFLDELFGDTLRGSGQRK